MPRTEILNNFVARTALVVLLLPMPYCVWAIGSDTAPSRQAFVSISSSPNTIMGFAGMYNGFMLYNYTTAVTFNSSFPVGTTMILNGGKVTLSQDLLLDSEAIIGTLGTIAGNNHTLEFAPHNQTIFLPYPGATNNVAGALNLATAGYTPYTVDWSADSQYIAMGNAYQVGYGPELLISIFDGSTSTLVATFTFGLDVNSVAWQPTASSTPYYLVAGTSSGLYAFQFTSSATLVLTSSIATGTTVSAVAWHPSGNWVAAGKNFPSEEIAIYNFNAGLLTTNTGYDFVPSQSVSRGALDFDYTGSYLAVGVNNANQLQVLHWDGTSLTPAASANTGAIVNTVSWSPDGSLIAIGMNSGTAPIQVYGFNRKSISLTTLPSYAESVAGAPIYAIDWSPDGRFIVAGCGTSYFMYIFAANTNVQRFLPATLYAGFAYRINTVKWAPNNIYFVSGEYHPTSHATFAIWNFIPGIFNLQNTNLVFNSPAQLRAPIICSGPCIIDCNGNTLDLNSQIITVTTGASLLFRNAVLEGITGANLQCIDSTGTVSFRNVACTVNNTMLWGQGSLAMIGDCTMTGTGTFIYSSSQISTIYPHAQWYFDRGMTFSYYPQSGANNLINFADNTAQLYLYETALRTQAAGLQFTKGIVAVEGRCPFYSDAVAPVNGILFGDNLTSANNVNLMILPESGIVCASGYVVDQNVGA